MRYPSVRGPWARWGRCSSFSQSLNGLPQPCSYSDKWSPTSKWTDIALGIVAVMAPRHHESQYKWAYYPTWHEAPDFERIDHAESSFSLPIRQCSHRQISLIAERGNEWRRWWSLMNCKILGQDGSGMAGRESYPCCITCFVSPGVYLLNTVRTPDHESRKVWGFCIVFAT